MIEIDNYITNSRYHKAWVTETCKACECEFDWQVCYEYGASWYEPEEVICPHCGAEFLEEEAL